MFHCFNSAYVRVNCHISCDVIKMLIMHTKLLDKLYYLFILYLVLFATESETNIHMYFHIHTWFVKNALLKENVFFKSWCWQADQLGLQFKTSGPCLTLWLNISLRATHSAIKRDIWPELCGRHIVYLLLRSCPCEFANLRSHTLSIQCNVELILIIFA